MEPLPDSTGDILKMAIAVMLMAGFARSAWWIRMSPAIPDPWEAEAEVDPDGPEAQPLCTRCLSPHEENDWFCALCGQAASPMTNWLPQVMS